jgi:hypothetical protein
MSTQSNGHSGNGNGNKPFTEAVSAESEVVRLCRARLRRRRDS